MAPGENPKNKCVSANFSFCSKNNSQGISALKVAQSRRDVGSPV